MSNGELRVKEKHSRSSLNFSVSFQLLNNTDKKGLTNIGPDIKTNDSEVFLVTQKPIHDGSSLKLKLFLPCSLPAIIIEAEVVSPTKASNNESRLSPEHYHGLKVRNVANASDDLISRFVTNSIKTSQKKQSTQGLNACVEEDLYVAR